MEQADLFRYVIGVLERLNVPYMLVGSFASAFYGEPRMTLDIDIVLSISPEHVDALCAAFGSEDYYISREAALEAISGRGDFNVIHAESGNKIDFVIAGADDYGREQLSRRRRAELLPGLDGYIAAPEDVIIGKMLYFREGGSDKHLRDITGMMRVSGDEIDGGYIAEWAARLNLLDIWQALVERVAGR